MLNQEKRVKVSTNACLSVLVPISWVQMFSGLPRESGENNKKGRQSKSLATFLVWIVHISWYSMDMAKIDKKKIAELAKRYDITLVVLFGSQVSGFTHKESDVDIAYMSDRKLSFDEEALLNTRLGEIMRNDKVSLVNLKTASPLLLKQVMTNALVLYEKTPHLATEELLYALRVYEEARPIFELRRQYLLQKINTYKHA